MRLIDADKLNLWTALRPYCSSDVCCEVTDIINNAPTVNPYEWISVEDRLPHSQQMVVGYTPCDGYMFVGFYQKVESPYYKSYWNIITSMRSTRKMTKKVTHWMPLPTPPTEKEN